MKTRLGLLGDRLPHRIVWWPTMRGRALAQKQKVKGLKAAPSPPSGGLDWLPLSPQSVALTARMAPNRAPAAIAEAAQRPVGQCGAPASHLLPAPASQILTILQYPSVAVALPLCQSETPRAQSLRRAATLPSQPAAIHRAERMLHYSRYQPRCRAASKSMCSHFYGHFLPRHPICSRVCGYHFGPLPEQATASAFHSLLGRGRQSCHPSSPFGAPRDLPSLGMRTNLVMACLLC